MLSMTNDIAPNTSITAPASAAGEAEMLIFALDRSRAQFAWKSGGLDAQALNMAHPPSAMTLARLIKHLAWVDDWTAVRMHGRIQDIDRPVRFTFDPGEKPNARRVLVDLHDEYARHVGHADLFREAVDGLVGEDPPQS